MTVRRDPRWTSISAHARLIPEHVAMRFTSFLRSRKPAPALQSVPRPDAESIGFHEIFGRAETAATPIGPSPASVAQSHHPAAGQEAHSRIVLLGLGLAPIKLLADYIGVVGSTLFAAPLETVFCSEPIARGAQPDVNIYVKLSLAECAGMIGVLEVTEETRYRLAMLGQFHRVCRSAPMITLEEATADFWHLAGFLAELATSRFGLDSPDILRSCWDEMRSEAMLLDDPFRWIARGDPAPLFQQPAYLLDTDYMCDAGGLATWSLMDGWYLEPWGAWSRGHVCRLRLRAPPGTRRLILICAKLRPDLHFIVSINREAAAAVTISEQGKDRIVIDMSKARGDARDGAFHVAIHLRNLLSPKALGLNPWA